MSVLYPRFGPAAIGHTKERPDGYLEGWGLNVKNAEKWSMVEPESVFPVDVLPEIKKEINKYVDQLMEKYAESNYNDTKYPSLEDLYKLVRAGKFKGYAYKKSALYGINVIVYEKLKELRDERKDLDQLGRTDPTVQAEGR